MKFIFSYFKFMIQEHNHIEPNKKNLFISVLLNATITIAEFIGGKFERVASGKSYDAFRFTFNN